MISVDDNTLYALKSPIKRIYIKFELYEKDETTFIKEITKDVTEDSVGQISCALDRPIRRSFSFALNNIANDFDWGADKLIWFNKRVKLYIGIKLKNGNISYIPQGVYILTSPSQSHNFDGKFTTIEGKDKAYLMTGTLGKFVNETNLAVGLKITDAIKIIANDIGETKFNFDNVTETLPYELTYDANSERWTALQDLANFAKCIIYYDVNGYLRLKKVDLNEIHQYSPVWSFKYGDKSERFYAGSVRQLDDQETANHIVVLGGGSQTATVSYELKVTETNPLWLNSPYTIEEIGRRTYFHNNGNFDPVIVTELDAKYRAKYELMRRLGYQENVSMNISPFYLLEVGDVIEIIDDENKVNGRYLINNMNIPLRPQLMSIEAQKQEKIISDWNFI